MHHTMKIFSLSSLKEILPDNQSASDNQKQITYRFRFDLLLIHHDLKYAEADSNMFHQKIFLKFIKRIISIVQYIRSTYACLLLIF